MLNMLSVTPADRANNPILAVRRNWAGETELARRAAPVLEHDLGKRLALRRGCAAQLGDDRLGHLEIGAGLRAIWVRDHRRSAGIGFLADQQVERDLAEKVHAKLLGGASRAAVAEDLGAAAAVRADEVAHVLDDAEHRHVHLAEHVERLARVEQRDVLGRRHDHRAGERHTLRHGQLRVAGAGRQVDHEIVQLAPLDVAKHLL